MPVPVPDLPHILRWRAQSEQARMSDLERLLPLAASGDAVGRRVALAHRIATHRDRAAAMPATSDGWAQLAGQSAAVNGLIDELVALLMTRTLRAHGLDGGTFDAAESFLAELISIAGIPPLVLGQTKELESIDHTLASVAMRFPGSRVWDLPFLAHELGHHAVGQLRHFEPVLADSRPLADVVAVVADLRAAANEPAGLAARRAHELVADVFATVVCGPAYPAACLSLRVPLGVDALRASGNHPSWAERIAATRAALDALSQQTSPPLTRFSSQRSRLIDPLALEVIGTLPIPTAAAASAAEATVAAILKHRPGLVFLDADPGIAVAAALRAGALRPPQGASVRAILDGAWRWRMDRSDPQLDDAKAVLVTKYVCAAAQEVNR